MQVAKTIVRRAGLRGSPLSSTGRLPAVNDDVDNLVAPEHFSIFLFMSSFILRTRQRKATVHNKLSILLP